VWFQFAYRVKTGKLERYCELSFAPRRLPYYLTCVTVAALPCSITAMNWALAAATLALLVCLWRDSAELRFPPLRAPLATFFVCTLLSILFSGHIRDGFEGIRKFYLFLMLLIVVSTVRTAADARHLLWGLAAATTLSAAWSLVQFVRKYQAAEAAGEDFRLTYTAGHRITGFVSHWMTLSGIEMIVLLLLAALLLFTAGQGRWLLAICAAVIAASLAAGYTRSMWMGTALGLVYLLWHRDRRWLIALPLAAGLLLALNPAGIGDRIVSIWKPTGDVDSNQFRIICRRTALEMIRAHPWFGLGPGQVRPRFLEFVPADIPRPLPSGAYIHMHNTYLQFGAERGLPALAALLWLLGKILLDLFRAARRDPAGWELKAAIAATIAVLAAGWYEHNLGNGQVLPLFLAAVGLGYARRPRLGPSSPE
jgi:putative inorganic carbon (hco3(-)) transporter